MATKKKNYKCPICKETKCQDEMTKVKTRHYCNDKCLDELKREQEKKNEDRDDWDELYHYIVDLYGHKPTGMMFKQLGEYRKDPYNYTNKGMYLTLKYFYETKEQRVVGSTGLGIIPYVYEEAKKNYIEQMEVSEYNSGYESNEEIEKVKINRRMNKNKENLINSIISFDDIDEELEEY